MKTQQQQTFEILMLDASGKSEITTVKSLLLAISYSEKLWKNAIISADQSELEDGSLGLHLQVSKMELPYNQQGVAFLVRATSTDFNTMEMFREKLFAHTIQKLGFGSARILTDTVSETLSLALYPFIKSVENALRLHVEKTLTKTLGLNWWELATTQELNQQVRAKDANEPHFKGFVDTRMSLTDFHHLTSLISKNKIVDAGFVTKWEALGLIRSRIVSNSVFTSQDYISTEQLCKDLLSLLGKQLAPLTEVQVRQEVQVKSSAQAPVPSQNEIEKSPIKEVEKQEPVAMQESTKAKEAVAVSSVPQQSNSTQGNFDMISENILLQELKMAQSLENGKYVDLKAFVTKTLEPKGYAVGSSYLVAKDLNEKGLVQIYDAKNDKGLFVKAIRTN